MSRRASLGVALIARDASRTLGACLDSIRPYVSQIVVGIDTLTADDTEAVAKAHGADVVFPVQVSDWHECPDHGRVLAQHFARARQESFARLDPSLDWWMWLDADDVFVGGEKLADVLSSMPQDAVGAWLAYDYSPTRGTSTTIFDRERILRASVGWRWEHRVHEVVAPLRPGPWIRTSEVLVRHQENAHKSQNSAARNLLLLEIDREEEGDRPTSRTLFYLGNQYFALGEWEQAARWYGELAALPERGQPVNHYELWQSYVYMSMALERLEDVDGGIAAAFEALKVEPSHPEPYFRLAALFGLAGEDAKVHFWTEQGRKMQEPPFFVFKNPLDYSFNNRLPLADALARQGRVKEARQELEAAYAVLPEPKVAEAIEHYRGIEQNVARGEEFKGLARYLERKVGDRHRPLMRAYEKLSGDVKDIASVRDAVMPLVKAGRVGSQPRIVFWCGRSLESWAPPKLVETGIGGSETAVVEIARRFAQAGWTVDVYNDAGRYEGVHDGVGYWDLRRWSPAEKTDVFVGWRNPRLLVHTLAPHARARVLWLHDLNTGPDDAGAHYAWDRVLGVSAWHAGMLRNYYGLSENHVDWVPNGIELDRFPADARKKPWQAVYASSPDRGLAQLLTLWPRIAEGEPGARLIVAYGFETFDRMSVGRPDMQAWKRQLMELMEKTPGVEYVGRLPQPELAKLYAESWAWCYPSSFLEVSCISAMEAMAGGAVPITSAAGALKETIGDAGVVLPGLPHSRPWRDTFVLSSRAVMADATIARTYQALGRARAQEFTWDKAFERWDDLIGNLLAGRSEELAA